MKIYKLIGTNIKKDISSLSGRCDFLVATPGRLLDLIENNNIAKKCQRLSVLIMDEADQLLDMGFRPTIDKILTLLPSKDTRQTLFFSATVPSAVKEISKFGLRPGWAYIDTVGEEVEQTHEHVEQSLTVCPDSEQLLYLGEILNQEIRSCQKAGKFFLFYFYRYYYCYWHCYLYCDSSRVKHDGLAWLGLAWL